MSSQFIINVTESNFKYEVINYSRKTPVLVDFWAEWCVPCKTLDPILRELATHAEGNFRLARLNVDENSKLAMRFNVSGIPAVKAFRDGKIVAEFSGIKPKDEVQKFLRRVVPSIADLQLDKGNSLLHVEQWDHASSAFYKVLEDQPQHPKALLGLAKTLLAQGQGDESLEILKNFPLSYEHNSAEKLIPLAVALDQAGTKTSTGTSSIDATYHHALRLVKLGNFPAALDGFLAVLRQDKHYRDDEAKNIMLALFEILGNSNPTTRQYRNELASILF
ncbi:MAG: tetratricopeptide repeat protein [Chloroflexota bacterium]|nr:tetratricopeptide repeat protein [Chloroflexota bacterium]